MKIFIRTLGCEKNTIDSEFAAGILVREGHIIVNNPEDADILMVNTCGFINDAKQQSINTILELAADRTKNQKLLVSGCLSQRYSHELEKAIPEVDAFIGVNDYKRLPEIINTFKQKITVSEYDKIYEELGHRYKLESNWTASIKIAEGCDHICTYCIIPFIRGGFRSRKPEDIISEARELAASGVKELVIIAQDVTAYGKDLGNSNLLPELIKELCRIEDLKWIRLMYTYEDEITKELIDVIKNEEKVCKYLDIPIQHSNDKILKAMNRRSTSTSIKATVAELRKQIPGIIIRTTLISGFPGERKEEFEDLFNFVRETRFDRLGVFAYSKEEGTAAARMKNQVRSDVKERRRDRIMNLQRQISLELNQHYIGKVFEVLVEENNNDGTYTGRTCMDAPEIDNGVIFKCEDYLEPGSFVNVLIDDAFDYDLSGHRI